MPSTEVKLKVSIGFGLIMLIIGAIFSVVGGSARVLNPFAVDKSKPFLIEFGKNLNFTFTYTQLVNGIDLSDLKEIADNLVSDQIKIDFVNGKLSVSANVKNFNGDQVAQIVNNNWQTANPDTLKFWDRNYNAFAFEIINSDQMPLLQVVMIGSNQILIDGLFYTTDGGTIYIDSFTNSLFYEINSVSSTGVFNLTPEIWSGSAVLTNETESEILENYNITKIFTYPALTDQSNLGKLAASQYPSNNPLSEPTFLFYFGIFLFIIGVILCPVGFENYKDAMQRLRKLNEAQKRAKKKRES